MITPLRNLVLVSLADDPPAEGLIQVVGRERQPSTHAIVEAVGAEVRDVRVGARVVISRLQGIAIGDDRLLLAEGAVLAQEPPAEACSGPCYSEFEEGSACVRHGRSAPR